MSDVHASFVNKTVKEYNMESRTKRILMLIVVVLCCINSSAFDFEANGMYFNIISASDRTVSLTYKDDTFNTYSGDVVIPASVTYNGMEFTVENVDYRTFRDCKDLKSITLPKGLKNFGTINTDWGVGGFYGCGVWDLYVPDIETWLNLNMSQSANPMNSEGSFYVNGELLEDLVIPDGITKIRVDCFYGCKSLKTATFSSSVRVIDVQAFSECRNLVSVHLNDEITEIGVNAFWECVKLKEINIPQSVRLLGDGANGAVFINCESLESPMVFPEGLETIPSYMFMGCKSLKEVVLPSTLNQIYYGAFNGCISLNSITSNAFEPPFCYEATQGASTIFENVDKFNCIIKVPAGSKALYAQADGWKQFFNIDDQSEYHTIEVVATEGGKVVILGNEVSGNVRNITAKDGEDVAITIIPDGGYRLASLYVNGEDVTDNVASNTYTVKELKANISIYVSFEEAPIYLTIKSAENGYISQQIQSGQTLTYIITPNDGWELESVSFNGSDVTLSMTGNTYTTPVITADAEMVIIYRQTQESNIRSASRGEINLYVSNGQLIVQNNGDASAADIYGIDGGKIDTIRLNAGRNTLDLSAGKLYIVRIGNETYKIML